MFILFGDGQEAASGSLPGDLPATVRATVTSRPARARSARRSSKLSSPDAERSGRETFMFSMDQVRAFATAGSADESFQSLVDRVDVAPEIKARGLGFVGGYHAADPDRISVQSLIKNTAADERPGSDRQ